MREDYFFKQGLFEIVGLTLKWKWAEIPFQCPHISVKRIFTGTCFICQLEGYVPKKGKIEDLKDFLCSPQHCPLSEGEKRELGITIKRCPNCKSSDLRIIEISNDIFSSSSLNDIVDYRCRNCGYEWLEQYGIKN